MTPFDQWHAFIASPEYNDAIARYQARLQGEQAPPLPTPPFSMSGNLATQAHELARLAGHVRERCITIFTGAYLRDLVELAQRTAAQAQGVAELLAAAAKDVEARP